ncbi:hypothetical protein VTL71DRAFT_229 [Oculimacula yallundae]|uniref:Uncharacterized protein n=1 Tax=Oculimacula yallundae TaxID=86028 RepID=A0ABR4D1P9_9HELO
MASLKPVIQYEWIFNCRHTMKQVDHTGSPASFNVTPMRMNVSEDCVYCKRFKPTADFTKSKAQLYKEAQEVVTNYEVTMAAFQKGIDQSPTNAEVVEANTKMKETFQLIRANQIVRVEQTGNGGLIDAGDPSSLTSALQKKVHTALSKSKILHQADIVRLERARKTASVAASKSAPSIVNASTSAAATIPTVTTTPAVDSSTAVITTATQVCATVDLVNGDLQVKRYETRCRKWEDYIFKIMYLGDDILGIWEDAPVDQREPSMITAEKELEDVWADIVKFVG